MRGPWEVRARWAARWRETTTTSVASIGAMAANGFDVPGAVVAGYSYRRISVFIVALGSLSHFGDVKLLEGGSKRAAMAIVPVGAVC